MPFPQYDTGTVSIAAGATSAIGTGTFWSPLAAQANLLFISGRHPTVVDAVADDTHLTIPEWQDDAVVDAEYRLLQFPVSSLQATRQLRDFLAQTATQGIPYVVPPNQEEPDDGTGDDGTVAIRFFPVPGVFWKRIDGHYVFQGNFLGIGLRGAWNAVDTYFATDIVRYLGVTYSAVRPNTNAPPPSSPDDWEVFVEAGHRIELSGRAAGRPSPSEILIEHVFSRPAVLPATLAETIVRVGVAATAATTFSLQKDGVQIATATIPIGGTHAVPTLAADVAFPTDAVFRLVAPASADATAADLLLNVVFFN